jgi:3-methyladenine DNA glycosylase/8-oxoguanine DNA glycosylase
MPAAEGRMERNMTFQEILLSHGITKEQCTVIVKEMMKNRIFLTKEEKIEERYQKLKQKREELMNRLDKSASHLLDQQRILKEKDKLLSTLEIREKLITNLKQEYDSSIADMIIISAIKKKLADTMYPELLVEKFDRSKLSINSKGVVEGLEQQLAAMEVTYKELFCTKSKCKDECNISINASNSYKEYQNDIEGRSMQHDE